MEITRKLASVQRILGVEEIPKADNIELVYILGWQCVAKKGQFRTGDLCIYFEIDSQLPAHEVFEFLEPRKYRVKTAKFMGVLSQGLPMPIEIIQLMEKNDYIQEGMDVTNIIGVTKYERETHRPPRNSNKPNFIRKYLMRYAFYRTIDRFIFPRRSTGNFPENIPKTDEERLQNIPSTLWNNIGTDIYLTEKLDGSSATYFYDKGLAGKKWGIFDNDITKGFGVCSRNLRILHDTNSLWWKIAKQYDMAKITKEMCEFYGNSIAIQGEIIGEGVQKNKYKLNGLLFYCYNIYDITNQAYLTLDERMDLCERFNLTHVPVLIDNLEITADMNMDWFVDFSTRKSVVGCRPLAEGVVGRDQNFEDISFKVISPKWLLKNDE